MFAFGLKVELSPRQIFTFDGAGDIRWSCWMNDKYFYSHDTNTLDAINYIIQVANYTAGDCGNKLPT